MINTLLDNPGYHTHYIEKGDYGDASKVAEELQEFLDALSQHCKIMALVELSDLVGAIQGYLDNNHPELSLHDLEVMARITSRAFKNGYRKCD